MNYWTTNKKRSIWLIALNIIVYSILVGMMGSCAHFTSTKSLSKASDIKSKDHTYLAIQYKMINIDKDEHRLIFRDSAGDLLEIQVDAHTNTESGFLMEVATNRSYQLEAISFKDKSYLLKNLTSPFLTRPNKVNYLGAIQFELKDSELIYSVLPPLLSLESLKVLLSKLNLKSADLLNPYTGKEMKEAFEMSNLEVISGKVANSFSDYVNIINPCYIKEWKQNPIVLGKLDFLVTEYNGVLRVKNDSSHHTGSNEFESCVWNSVSASHVTDKNFQLKLPGVLYF